MCTGENPCLSILNDLHPFLVIGYRNREVEVIQSVISECSGYVTFGDSL